MGLFDGLLSGLGWIWDQTAGRATSAVWDQIVNGLVSWVVNSISWFVAALLQFFDRSSTPVLAANWFSGGPIGDGAHSPYGVVAGLALNVLVLCVLVSVVHGLLTGEGPAIIGRIARDVPLAVLGIVATISVVQVLLGTADELSTRILVGTEAGAHATAVLRALGQFQASSGQPTFVVFLLGLVTVLGAFVLWLELLVRASLLYVLIALSPFAYAAFVWPSARRVLHRLAELTIALVFSKVVIAVTLAVAASALASPNTGGLTTGDQKIGTLLVGTIMFLLAAFSPFLLLRLLPVVEAAVVAHGISRAPARTAQRAMFTALTVTRLAGSTSSGSTPAAGAGGTRDANRLKMLASPVASARPEARPRPTPESQRDRAPRDRRDPHDPTRGSDHAPVALGTPHAESS